MPISTMLKRVSRMSSALGEHADLADDFAGGQIPDEPHLAGQAERARHRAADLGRDAEGHRRRVGDEHRLDLAAVGEPQQELLGAVDRSLALRRCAGVVSANSSRERGAQLARQVGHRVDVGDAAAVDPAEDLARAEALVAALVERRLERRPLELGEIRDRRWSRYLSRFNDLPTLDLTAA